MAPTLAAGPLLELLRGKNRPNGGGPSRPALGSMYGPPNPPEINHAGTCPRLLAWLECRRNSSVCCTPVMQGPPHRLQADLFGVRRSLSARPYLCRLTLSGCHAWVCLGISPALMVPRSSAFHSVFSATHGRKANTKGTVTPLWMYKKLEKKKKKSHL